MSPEMERRKENRVISLGNQSDDEEEMSAEMKLLLIDLMINCAKQGGNKYRLIPC